MSRARFKSSKMLPNLRLNLDEFLGHTSKIAMYHHFSSIAGAGPIVCPFIAAAAFGWLLVIVRVVVGTIFTGGPDTSGYGWI